MITCWRRPLFDAVHLKVQCLEFSGMILAEMEYNVHKYEMEYNVHKYVYIGVLSHENNTCGAFVTLVWAFYSYMGASSLRAAMLHCPCF